MRSWVARKAIKRDWPAPHAAPVIDSYTFEVFAFADRQLDVPAYDPTVDSHYVHQLDGLFTSLALDSAEIAFTADAVPGAISDNGTFNCANAPLAPDP